MENENSQALPQMKGELARIAEMVGYVNALALLGAFYGQRKIIFSSQRRGQAWRIMVGILGHELAERLCTEYEGEVVDISKQSHIGKVYRDDTIKRLKEAGTPTVAICEALGISKTTVRNATKEEQNKQQLNLLEGTP
jgi:DNA invertase Pin-like site-specific DNA recombinase